MKAVVERAALARAMGEAARIVQARNTIPILSNVKIEAEGEGLRLTATDLDLQITVPVAARVDAAGATTAPAHRLAGIVSSMPEGCQISLSLTDGKLTVAGGRSRFVLPVLPVDDFPVIAPPEDGAVLDLDPASARALFEFPASAISTEETRYYLNGICLEHVAGAAFLSKPALTASATDGHRLLRSAIQPPPEAITGDVLAHRPIVPRLALGAMARLIDGAKSIRVQIAARMMVAEFGDVTLISKLIDGKFPDSDRVIRSASAMVATVNPADLSAAAKRVAQVAAGKTRAVRLTFAADMLTLSCTSPEYGTATEEMPCILTGGDGLETACNVAYLADMMAGFAGDEVRLELADASAPIVIRKPQGKKAVDDVFLGVLMPMRV